MRNRKLTVPQVLALLVKPLEWHMYLLGGLMILALYLQIVLCPIGILVLLSLIVLAFIEGPMGYFLVGSSALLGMFIGISWAESIRKKYGVLRFHAWLLSTPEIDGWRDEDGKPIKRHRR